MVEDQERARWDWAERQRRSIAEKRKIVEQQATLPGASVAAVARQNGVNANMVHYWRNLYRQGPVGGEEERQHPSAAGED